MKKFAYLLTIISALLIPRAYALTEAQAEDIAGLTAVYIFLKNDCGYSQIPNAKIEQTIAMFARNNQWDLSNYNAELMFKLNKESYYDLKGINIPSDLKCDALARNTLGISSQKNK